MKKNVLILSVMFLLAVYAQAATFTFNGSGDWSNTANWFGGTLPGPTDDVVIANMFPSASATLDMDVTVNSITIGGMGAGELIINGHTLNIGSGGLTIGDGGFGPGSLDGTAGGTININGGDLTVNSNGNFNGANSPLTEIGRAHV